MLSDADDLDRVDEVRDGVDAALVGANTFRRDDPRLLVRPARVLAGPEPADLSGFTFAGNPVRRLWVVPILERERQIAMDEGSGSLVSRLAEEGRSWIAGPGDRAR